MKEEDTLMKKIGKDNSFKIPENYFENLIPQVMESLPEKENPRLQMQEVTTWTKIKPFVYMAAMFIGAFLIIKVARTDFQKNRTDVAMQADTEQISDEMIDVAMDRAMLDDYSLYVYLNEPESNDKIETIE